MGTERSAVKKRNSRAAAASVTHSVVEARRFRDVPLLEAGLSFVLRLADALAGVRPLLGVVLDAPRGARSPGIRCKGKTQGGGGRRVGVGQRKAPERQQRGTVVHATAPRTMRAGLLSDAAESSESSVIFVVEKEREHEGE